MGFWGISFQNRDVLWNFEAGSSQIWGEMGETIAEYGHMVKPMAWLFPVKNWIILDLVSTGRLECVWKQDIASSLGYIDLGIIYIYTYHVGISWLNIAVWFTFTYTQAVKQSILHLDTKLDTIFFIIAHLKAQGCRSQLFDVLWRSQ